MSTWVYSNVSAQSRQSNDQAIQELKRSLKTAIGNQRVDIYNDISWEYRTTLTDSALYYARKAEAEALKNKYTKGQIKSLNFQGIAYRNKSDYSHAFEKFVEALKLAEEINDAEQVGYSNINLGNIYINQTNYEGALEYFEKALKNATTNNFTEQIAYSHLNIGRSHAGMANYDLAEQHFLKTRQIREELNDQVGLGNLNLDLASLYIRMEDFERADLLLINNIELIDQLNLTSSLVDSYALLAESKLKQGKIEEATKFANDCLVKAQQYELRANEAKAYRLLSEIAESKINYADALTKFKTHVQKRDSIFNEENTRKIENLHANYKSEKIESEARFLRQLVQKQEAIIVLIVVGSILLLAIAVITYRTAIIRKRLNKEIEEQKEKAIDDKLTIQAQAQKLQELDIAKSRFFANISHDLRSPLTLILGNYDLVINDKETYLTDKTRHQVEIARKNAQRLMYLTDEINELNKLQDGKLELKRDYIPVNSYLSALVKMFEPSAEYKSVALNFESDLDHDDCIYIDVAQFEKIIFNLVSNAFKHSNIGDSVTVSVKRRDGDYIAINVIDTGAGIPENALPYIFDRYYQAPTGQYHVFEGVGIGLSLVKELVDSHDASISVDSLVDKGSIFTIDMHSAKIENIKTSLRYSKDFEEKTALWADLWEKTYEPNRDISVTFEKPKHEVKILLVDDHPEVREYIRNLISDQYEIIEAADGKKALEILAETQVDLVITDLMMPWMDGFELLERMKADEELKKIPVLVVSARNTEDDRFKVLSSGVNNIIQKPFNRDEIMFRIQNLLSLKADWSKEGHAIKLDDTNLMSDIEKELLERLEKFIINKMDDPDLGVLDLANEVSASERKLYRMVKKIANLTPYEFIREIRWQYLEKLIKDRKIKNASEAARMIGMKNVTNFKKQFSKKFHRDIEEMIAKSA